MSSCQTLQEELDHTKSLLAAQKQEYDSLQTKHRSELEQLREAGNSALALIVEEYKVSDSATCIKILNHSIIAETLCRGSC